MSDSKDVVYYARSKKQAETLAKLLPRIFQGPVADKPWQFTVDRDTVSAAWGVFIAPPKGVECQRQLKTTRDAAHGWCRGYLYAAYYARG